MSIIRETNISCRNDQRIELLLSDENEVARTINTQLSQIRISQNKLNYEMFKCK